MAALLMGCGSGDAATSMGDTTAASTPPHIRPPGAIVRTHAADWGELKRLAAPWSERLLVPDGPSPRRVLVRDLKLGTGPTIKPNDSFWANYVTFFYSSGEPRQGVWQTTPEQFTWNINRHVDAWIPGLKGMRAGGVRELVAPSSWAYGDGPLVYLVKLVKLEPI